MSERTGARRRLGSIRLSLILLALVPSVTLVAMWGITTKQMFDEGLRLRGQTQLSRSTGAMGTDATLALQQERTLSAAWLADPHGSRAALEAQRKETDKAVAKLVGQSDAIDKAPARISDRLYSVVGSVGSLEYFRGQVDNPTDITAAQALDQYSSIIDDQIHAFQELSQVDDGDLTSQAGPLVALEHAAELVSQEDAQLTMAWPSGHLSEEEWNAFAELVDARRWLVRDQIVPALSGSAKTQTVRILQSPEWQTLQGIEDQVLASRPSAAADGKAALPDARRRTAWAGAFDKIGDRYTRLIDSQTSGLLDQSADKADNLLLTAASLSAGGLIALLLCVGMSWRITRSLSRRLRGLREATLSLAEERLPDVVARLDRGETVDADLAAPPLDYGGDELGQVARAFNKAQRTAVHTAVELADTRRGFQKVILGIARQSQNLINLQLTKLDALERRHSDPDVLSGLYELDSTASQLRRYEENLVIISGEQPRRSWREPVALVDILRSAVGEVAEYQRVEVHTDEDVSGAARGGRRDPPAGRADRQRDRVLARAGPRRGARRTGGQGPGRGGRGPRSRHVGGGLRLLQRPVGGGAAVRRGGAGRRPQARHVRDRPSRHPARHRGHPAPVGVRRNDGDRAAPARDRRTGVVGDRRLLRSGGAGHRGEAHGARAGAGPSRPRPHRPHTHPRPRVLRPARRCHPAPAPRAPDQSGRRAARGTGR